MDGTYIAWGGLYLVAIVFGALLIAARNQIRPMRNVQASAHSGIARVDALWLLYILTCAGYFFFFAGALKGGLGLAVAAFHGNRGALYGIRNYGQLLPGISSLTQVGPAFIVGVASLRPGQPGRARLNTAAWSIFGLAVLRSYLWSERLATIEIVVPLIVFKALTDGWPQKLWIVRVVTHYGPLAVLTSAVTLFGMFEYLRSWGFYSTIYRGNFVGFVVDRFALYYGLALSNGRLLLEYVPQDLSRFNFTLEILYRLPGLSKLEFAQSYPRMWGAYFEVLRSRANMEFNNQSGIFSYAYDFGKYGVLPVFVVLGMWSQNMFLRSRAGYFSSTLLYPFVFLTLLEILRAPYLTSSRCAYLYAGLAVIWLTRQRATVPVRATPALVLECAG